MAGFALSTSLSQLRTIKRYVYPTNRNGLIYQLPDLKDICEITCFWMTKDIQKWSWTKALILIELSIKAFFRKEKWMLFGTKSQELAAIFNLPSSSNLIHTDVVKGIHAFVFIAKIHHVLKGICEVIIHKVLNSRKKKNLPAAILTNYKLKSF